jgi:hypothetical protein
MPGFGLTHKPSRSKLRQSTVADPIISENAARSRTQTHPQPLMSPAPSPVDPVGGSGFKLFSWKKRANSGPTPTSPGTEPRPYYPSEPPRPILKSTVSDQGPGGSIRFAKSAGGVWDSPVSPSTPEADAYGAGGSGIPLFNRVPPQLQIQIHQANIERQSFSGSPTRAVSVNRTTSPMRSSRPASPAASSFGHRVRTGSAPPSVGSSSLAMQAIAREPPRIPVEIDTSVLCSPPPNMPMHVTTPPTTYYPPSQSRAPPSSPYRPTTTQERRRSSSRALPARLPLASEMAPRPPRISSLYCESPQYPSVQARSSPVSRSGDRSSVITLPGVPMLNIIPATPQDGSDEFAGARGLASPANRRKAEVLEESIELEERDQEVEEIASESLPRMSFAPAIELTLDFSPFSPTVDLPFEDSDDEEYRPEGSLPPSPPFESYPSLPSLSSEQSIQPSEQSMSSSSSISSIMSFPDVEEALGSMLASLSDGNLPSVESSSSVVSTQAKPAAIELNPGLGLGLDLPEPASITAPLFTRKAPPPKIDTSRTLPFRESAPNSAPLVINHRVAFYGTAKAHPRSPSSGTFHHSLEDVSFKSNDKTPQPIVGTMSSTGSSSSLCSSSRDSTSTIGLGLSGCRDSMSINSECSDEDLHTASIINLTPVMGRKLGDVRGEEVIVEDEGVGYAL